MDLARSAGQDVSAIATDAKRALVAAGDRAYSLNASAAAVRFYREALALCLDDASHERALLRYRLALSMADAGDDDRVPALEQARDELLVLGDVSRAAAAESRLADIAWVSGDRRRVVEHLERSHELVRELPASAETVAVLARFVRLRFFAGNYESEIATEALRMAEELGLDERVSELLVTIGTARVTADDQAGRADVQRGIDLAISINYWFSALRGYSNLASFEEYDGDLRASVALNEEALRTAERMGTRDHLRWASGNIVSQLAALGDWQRAAEMADALIAQSEALDPHYLDSVVRCTRAKIRLARGDIAGAAEDARRGLEAGRVVQDSQVMDQVLAQATFVLADAGDVDAANALCDEIIARGADFRPDSILIDVVIGARRLGRAEEVARWLARLPDAPWKSPALAYVGGEVSLAAARLDEMAARHDATRVRLYGADGGPTDGGGTVGRAELENALEFARSVDASRYIELALSLLGSTS
jgi:tetratricopeptide (TPR) repeat protein